LTSVADVIRDCKLVKRCEPFFNFRVIAMSFPAHL